MYSAIPMHEAVRMYRHTVCTVVHVKESELCTYLCTVVLVED